MCHGVTFTGLLVSLVWSCLQCFFSMADPSATPLTNADFRKLLATPRPGRGPSETPRPNATPRGDADKAKAKKNFHKPKPKPVGAADEEEDDGPKYRCVCIN